MFSKVLNGLLTFAAVTLTASIAMASDGGASLTDSMPFAIAFGMTVAAAAGAYGQAKTASAALEGIARNPAAGDKLFVPMILGLAFIESLVLFTWVLMFLMQGKM